MKILLFAYLNWKKYYYIIYTKNEFQLINSFKINELNAINYIIKQNMKINKVKFNCTENLSFNYRLNIFGNEV